MRSSPFTITAKSVYWTVVTLIAALVFSELLFLGTPWLESLLYSLAVVCGMQAAIHVICLGTLCICGKNWQRRAVRSGVWLAVALLCFYIPQLLP